MLGRRVTDPDGVEALPGSERRRTRTPRCRHAACCRKRDPSGSGRTPLAGFQVAPQSAKRLQGYEIHMGETILGGVGRSRSPILSAAPGEDVEVLDGAVTRDGRVFGTYLHGSFTTIPSAAHSSIGSAAKKGWPNGNLRSRMIRMTSWPRISRTVWIWSGCFASVVCKQCVPISSSFLLPCCLTG